MAPQSPRMASQTSRVTENPYRKKMGLCELLPGGTCHVIRWGASWHWRNPTRPGLTHCLAELLGRLLSHSVGKARLD